MRIGILSDIHANLEALVQVEAVLGRLGVDRVICLGDVVGYGASPNDCCERIRALASITLLGNHDAAVSGRMDYAYYYDAARQALDWTVQQLDPDHLVWLRSLPYAHRVDDLAFSHGSPILPGEFDYIFAVEQAKAQLEIMKSATNSDYLAAELKLKFAKIRHSEHFAVRREIHAGYAVRMASKSADKFAVFCLPQAGCSV